MTRAARSLAFTALFVVSVSAFARATPLTQDLGEGLTYYRAHALPADLPPPDGAKGPLVLDLRFVSGDRAAAATLGAWLNFRRSENAPVFVLYNEATSSALRAAANPRGGRPGVLTLAPRDRSSADLAINTTPDADRRAYDALEHGTDLATLLASEPDKERHDEAALVRDRTAPAPTSDDEPTDDITSAGSPPADTAAAPPPPTDLVLQRAVQLHRALRALKRL